MTEPPSPGLDRSPPEAPRPEQPASPVFPPWSVRQAVGVVVVFALAQLLLSWVISTVLAAGLPVGAPLDAATEDRLFAYTLPLTVVGSHGVAWVLIWLLLRARGLPLLVGLRLGAVPPPGLVRSFLAGMALQLVSTLLVSLMPPPEDFVSPLVRYMQYGTPAALFLVVMAVGLAPLLEEALFRGLLLPAVRKHLGFWPAAVVVSALFAALHGMQTGWFIPALVGITAAGLALAWLRETTGSLWYPIAFHMGFNFLILIPVIVFSQRGAEFLILLP